MPRLNRKSDCGELSCIGDRAVQALFETSYSVVPHCLMHEIGRNEATLICYLSFLYKRFGGEFWRTSKRIQFDTGLTRRFFEKARRNLVERGLISYEVRGPKMMQYTYYTVDEDMVVDLVQKSSETFRKKAMEEFGYEF